MYSKTYKTTFTNIYIYIYMYVYVYVYIYMYVYALGPKYILFAYMDP